MRALQFWILLLGSLFVSGLLIKQIFLERTLDQTRRDVVDCQETASSGQSWQRAWQQLAADIYQVGPQDPAFIEALKKESIAVHEKSSEGTNSAPVTPPSAPPVSSKTPVAPLHPATP